MQHRRDPAALQYHQYITAVQRQRGVVQADQRGLAAGVDQLRQQRGHPAAVRKVKRTVRLVQQEQRRILGNRARQNTELLLAAAQRQVVLPGLVGQTYGAQGLVRSGAHGGGGALQDPQPRVEAHKHDLPRRERDRDAALLRDIADGLRKPAGGQALQRDAVQKALPGVGQETTLYTVMSVTENDVSLYGFATEEQQACFEMLTAVSGVGPKVGLAILSVMEPQRVALAISAGDHKAFKAASGVGPKLAQRIVLELKDKVAKGFVDGISLEDVAGSAADTPATQSSAQAIAALVSLGYSQSEAALAIAKIDAALPVEEIIKLALRSMAGRR